MTCSSITISGYVRRRAARLLASYRDLRVVKGAQQVAIALNRAVETADSDLMLNGERRVIETLSAAGCRRYLDGGANAGDWTALVRAASPLNEVVAVEPIAPMVEVLRQRFGRDPLVTVVPFALGSGSGSKRLFQYDGNPALTSAFHYPHDLESSHITVTTRTIDDIATDLDGAPLNVIKLDLEGSEADALEGASGCLQDRSLRAVQFEYGRVNILSNFLLHDAYCLFRNYGMTLGKVLPGGVRFREYRLDDENFFGSNFLAVRPDDGKLIDALAGKYR